MNDNDIANVLSVWEKENTILKPTNKEFLLEIVDQVASLFSAGTFYYYIFSFDNLIIEYVNDGVEDVLGIKTKDFSMNKIFEIMHPEDLEIMHKKEAIAFLFASTKIAPEDILLYKNVYMIRLKHKDGKYRTILHQAKAINMSDDGKIQHVICIHTDITYLNVPFNHHISYVGYKRPSFHSIDLVNIIKDSEKHNFKDIFTTREKEIIKKLTQGKDFNEIAKLLFVSPHTINTHKKNMLRKSSCKNTAELIARCYIEGLI